MGGWVRRWVDEWMGVCVSGWMDEWEGQQNATKDAPRA